MGLILDGKVKKSRGGTHSLKESRQSKRDFPGGAVVKNPRANAGDMCSSPGAGRSHMPRSN